ncbi:hypothetical protein L9F63_002031, partial [Diploptera punctata]
MNYGVKKEQSPHPRTSANIFSILTFSWTRELFKKGYRKDLEVDDLYDVLEEDRSDLLGNTLERVWNQELKLAKKRKKKPSFLKVLVKCFGPKAMFLGVMLGIAEIVFRLTQPLFLGGLIRYFTPDSDVSMDTAYLYAVCIVICSALNVFVKQAYMLAMFHTGMKMRVGVCSLIYRKALKLSKTALRETTVGQAVNLISNDVNRFDMVLFFSVYVFIGPIHCIIMAYIMWREVGISAFVGITTILLFIPTQVALGKRTSTLRMRTAKRTDERIRFMNEIIVGIQVIKMYAWEKPFSYLVSLARKYEIQAIRATSYTRGILLSSEKFATRISIFVTILTFYFLDNKISAEKVFVVTAYFNILRQVMTDFFPRAIQVLAESSVSVKRVQTFLLYDEVSPAITNVSKDGECIMKADRTDKVTVNGSVETTKPESSSKYNNSDRIEGVKISNVTAKWFDDVPDNTLTNINVEVKPGELVAIIGPVGAGKTSLVHTILKELPIDSGSISMGGRISYASQEPWLFTGSVRQNILFGEAMNRERYRKVVRVCALERDFELLPHGDKTIVGERGITLSGGQRARVNLARAVYKEADIYLLDDPLSAVDTHVGRHLFEDCINDFLQDKTRILVTHQLQYLHAVDNIVILNNGAVEAKGTFSELQDSGVDFASQLGLETDDENEKPFGASIPITHLNGNILIEVGPLFCQLSQHISPIMSLTLGIEEPEQQVSEMRSRGKVSANVYKKYFQSGGHWCFIIAVFGVCIFGQVAQGGGDYWMSYWTNVEEVLASLDFNSTIGGVTEFSWMPSTDTCIYIYIGFVVLIIILTVMAALCLFNMCMRASVRLHDAMFSCIIRTKMAFFNKYPSGQILNRFSKDMGSVDESLPMTLLDCIQIGLSVMGVVLLVAIVNLWLLIPTVFMFVMFYLLRMYYLSTSRSLKRLDGITRSPVFSHLNASLQGLTTIRAFGAQALLEKEFDNQQDLHSTTWYLAISCNRAFGLWLDSTCVVYIGFVTLSFLIIGGEQYGGDVGLAITQAIGLTGMLQWGIRQSAELENQMTSVERVLEYTQLEKEPSEDNLLHKRPPAGWPTKGAIVFDRVFLTYLPSDPPVLKNVSFVIKPAEKIGIVGRTGAGKTSLITALFRLVELSGGTIRIDGVDISVIGLYDLRSSISIIPQEPALFSGPLRNNLDPFKQYSDTVVWSALEEVELKQEVKDLPAGLNHKVSEGGSNFSVGQRQLLCLARAIIRNNRILVLDEATANSWSPMYICPKTHLIEFIIIYFHRTDELIQATIRRKFADCTVLTIAHRLHTVMDSDRIIVMDAGSMVEFEHPYVLLKNKKGVLYQMVEQTGHAMAESLHKVAETYHEKPQIYERKMSDLEDFDHVFGICREEEFDRVYQRIQLEEQENRHNIARCKRRHIRLS